MALKIYWTDFAKSALYEIFDFNKKKAGIQTSQKLVEGIVKSTNILSKQPFTGQKEELLSDRPESFRYVVFKNYKIIYWINQTTQRVEVVDVFDTRQNPEKINRK
ncbi:plasmid stabilization system protein ParE [Breznakibacter xylanolyticus]|uniref:Plasmid stabilization system protein ParE n=1 Tax=Breznakibacter xylanolyticus TaxID=990 RepID=A0A2W7NMV4_9BACT|nr:type II toxin-antitoxin system RelE/ParE family toxin [Breznakibacter xylanolyticus]PZX19437.1 plasmid stabilization system protein ParE [Breznakibacter xylanolyticus]